MPEHYQPEYVETPFWASANSWAIRKKENISTSESSMPDYFSMQSFPLSK